MLFLFKIIIFFSIIICFHFQAYSRDSCYGSFADLDAFALSMTEGLRLGKKQGDLFDIYKQIYFAHPNQRAGGSFNSMNRVLRLHHELSKMPVREQHIIFEERVHDVPQSLIDFVKRFRNSAGEVRNNLFRIYENLGFWRKALSFPKPVIDSSLSRDEKREARKEENKKFLEYLNKFIDEKVLRFIRDPAKGNKEITVFMYNILNTIREAMLAEGRDTGYISQTMLDLVHTSGFGNPLYVHMLKSESPRDQVEGINKILGERDDIALALGFESHFSELRQFLGVDHPTGSTKKEDLAKVLEKIEKDIEKMPYIVTGTSVLRVRPLSLQESPFRACLAVSDCSSETYFDKALDPNFLYWTITDENHKSEGHVTVVLGAAGNTKIAFVDKIQDISNEKLLPMLESIRLSLHEQGYKLALPKDVGGGNGLSNTNTTRSYVQSEILPKLEVSYTGFKPHENGYAFRNRYSRAYLGLRLLEFQLSEGIDFVIEPGDIKQAQQASKDLNVETLFKEVLSLQNSDKEEDQIQFINNLLILKDIKGLSLLYPPNNHISKYMRQFQMKKRNYNFIYNYLMERISNPAHSFRLRKSAFWTLTEFLYKSGKKDNFWMTFLKVWNEFSEEEQNLLFGEISNWKNSDQWKQTFIEELSEHFSDGVLSEDAKFFLEHKLIRLFIDFKNEYAARAFLAARGLGEAKTINIPMGEFYAGYVTALMIAANHIRIKTVDDLLRILINSWNEFSEEEQNLLFVEISNWKSSNFWKQTFIEELSKYFSDGILSEDAKFFLEHKLTKIFTNLKDGFVINAFMMAAARGDMETVDFFIKKGIDIHVENKFYYGWAYGWALVVAVDNGQTETVDLLLKNGANIKKNFYGDSLLTLAAWRGHTETVDLLIKRGADIHYVNPHGETILIAAASEGHTETVDLLIKRGADIHYVNYHGQTALSKALKNGHIKTVQLLIKRGADISNINPFRLYFMMIKSFVSMPFAFSS